MAYKTMLRQLISKWGIMSTDMQEAYQKDQAVIESDGNYEYVDNDKELDILAETPQEVAQTENTEQVNIEEI